MSNWFTSHRVREGLYLTRELKFFEGNRANIWLLRGPGKDVVIDTGLGVSDLRRHLETQGLIEPAGGERECTVICTHNHFDHSGGAHHFERVLIHQDDLQGLQNGRQTETLNYVKPEHFAEQPYAGFSACSYRVPPTHCDALRDGAVLDIGGGEHLEILHVPGHTQGSIAIYYPHKRELFTGDFLYECGSGGGLIDWLPSSSIRQYVHSARTILDWMQDKDIAQVYPGHFHHLPATRASRILQEYVDEKDDVGSRCCATSLQCATWTYFLFGCFRCCPC